MVALPNADAGQLAAIALAGAGFLFVPVEHGRALVQRLLDEGGRERAAIRADLAGGLRRVELADRNPVDAELACRLVEDGFERRHELVLAGTALRARGRRIREHRHAAIAHRLRLVEHRETYAGRAEVAGALVRAGLLHDVEVGGEELAVGTEAELHTALETRPRAADRIFLGARDAMHDRTADLLRQQRGDRHVGIAGDLAAEAAAAELRDEDEVFRRNADETRDVGDGRGVALIRAMQETLATLPIGEGRARLHAVVRIAAGDEALVHHEFRCLEAGFKVAVGPCLGRLAHRQLVIARRGEVAGFPFYRLQVDLGGSDIAVRARVGTARKQALERIDHVRKLLKIDLDRLDGLRCRSLAFGRDGKDRVADIGHFVLAQDRRLRWRKLRHVVRGEDAEEARHLGRRRGVDVANPRVRHRARQRLAERHALSPKVLGVLGAAGDLGHHVDGREIFSNEFVSHLQASRAARMTAFR